MTKKEMRHLLDSVISGYEGYRVDFRPEQFVRLYSDNNVFTASMINRAFTYARLYFIGIRTDLDGKTYMLFSYL